MHSLNYCKKLNSGNRKRVYAIKVEIEKLVKGTYNTEEHKKSH